MLGQAAPASDRIKAPIQPAARRRHLSSQDRVPPASSWGRGDISPQLIPGGRASPHRPLADTGTRQQPPQAAAAPPTVGATNLLLTRNFGAAAARGRDQGISFALRAYNSDLGYDSQIVTSWGADCIYEVHSVINGFRGLGPTLLRSILTNSVFLPSFVLMNEVILHVAAR